MQRAVPAFSLIFLFFVSSQASAQWLEQVVELRAGWNAVFLEVEPYPAQCDDQFQGIPVQSVWTADRRFNSVEFIQDPGTLAPGVPSWRHYFPPDDLRAAATNLFALEANTAYLIQVSEDTTWTVTGKPRLTNQAWRPDQYNLTGFFVDPANPPTMAAWFQNSAAHSPLDIWRLTAAGNWEKVLATSSTNLESGRAYWVFCNGESTFQGPVEIDLVQGREIDFVQSLVERELEISRLGTAARTVTVSAVNSQAPPLAPSVLRYAGAVPLTWLGQSSSGDETSIEYLSLPASLTFPQTDRRSRLLRLAVDRTAMGASGAGEEFQSVLEIKDGQGYRRAIGVTSLGRERTALAKAYGPKGITTPDPSAGLWVGNIVLNQVSDANLGGATTTPADSEFQYRVILHVDAAGDVRLLNEVVQLWRPGTNKPDPTNPQLEVPDQPGRYILLTPTAPASLVNEIGNTVLPGSLRDGQPFARRISTAAYSLVDADRNPEEPVFARTGAFGTPGGTLAHTLVIEDDDPANPFRHRYHAQHRYSEPGENRPDWTINWTFAFTFTEDPPDGLNLAGWGDTQMGGTFRQTLEGLAAEPVVAEGFFRIQRASTVAVLNDGLGSG